MLRVAEKALHDLRYAARRLRRTPGFSIVATLLIAVSLASSTVVFGVVDVLLLRTLPVRDAQRLVQVFELRPNIPAQEYLSTEFRDLLASESTTLTDVVGEREVTTTLEREALTSRVDVGLVTPNYHEALGVGAALGRYPGAGDDTAGNRIAVLSHRAWTRDFAAAPSIVGRTIRLGGRAYVIVGVEPPGFNGTSLDSGPDFRVLFANREDFAGAAPSFNAGTTKIVARLRPGESLASAAAETQALWTRHREAFLAAGGTVGIFDRELSAALRPIPRGTSRVREQFEGTLLLLGGGAGLLLAMVCLNVGGVLLARAAQSRKETAVRRALGAGLGGIARLWAAESLVLATIGGAAGLALAAAALPAFVRWLTPLIGFGGLGRPPALDVPLDLRVATFAIAATLGTAAVAAVVPTLWWARRDAYRELKASTDDRESRRIQSGLSVVQIALSTVLLLAGGLLTRTLDGLDAVDAGFDRGMLVRFTLEPRLAGYDGPAAAGLARRLLDEAADLPGVETAAITATPVMQGLGTVMIVALPGERVADGAWNTNVNRVTPGYFETMGIALSGGAGFEDRLAPPDGPAPVVVNEAFVHRFFGDGAGAADAVGRVFDSGVEFEAPSYRIVGIVGDASYRSLRESNPPMFYTNLLADEWTTAGAFSLLVRTPTPEAVIGPVRALVRSIDPALPVLDAVTMSEEVERSLWRERLAAALTRGFASIGLAVAAIGLYAILAQYVAARRKEIGLRIALGAARRDVLRFIARRVMPLLLLGIAAGTVLHLALSRWAASLLYEVRLLDPVAVSVSIAAVLLVSLLAAMAPLRRAIAIDPASTLRDD